MPETSEVASSVEMREVIELATEKALRAYVEMAERAGLSVTPSDKNRTAAHDDEKYKNERTRGWA